MPATAILPNELEGIFAYAMDIEGAPIVEKFLDGAEGKVSDFEGTKYSQKQLRFDQYKVNIPLFIKKNDAVLAMDIQLMKPAPKFRLFRDKSDWKLIEVIRKLLRRRYKGDHFKNSKVGPYHFVYGHNNQSPSAAPPPFVEDYLERWGAESVLCYEPASKGQSSMDHGHKHDFIIFRWRRRYFPENWN